MPPLITPERRKQLASMFSCLRPLASPQIFGQPQISPVHAAPLPSAGCILLGTPAFETHRSNTDHALCSTWPPPTLPALAGATSLLQWHGYKGGSLRPAVHVRTQVMHWLPSQLQNCSVSPGSPAASSVLMPFATSVGYRRLLPCTSTHSEQSCIVHFSVQQLHTCCYNVVYPLLAAEHIADCSWPCNVLVLLDTPPCWSFTSFLPLGSSSRRCLALSAGQFLATHNRVGC